MLKPLIKCARTRLAALALPLLIGLGAHAQSADDNTFPAPARVDAGNAVVSLVSENIQAVPGETFRAAVVLDIDEGWHVYWINAGDSGIPPKLTWRQDNGAAITDFAFPYPHEQPFEGLMNYGYEGRLVLPFEMTLPADAAGQQRFDANVSYLICADICIPEKADLSLTIETGDTADTDSLGLQRIEEGIAKLPASLDGPARIDRSGETWSLSIADAGVTDFADASHVRFFPYDHQIEHLPEQPLSHGPDGIALTLTPAKGFEKDGALEGVIVAEFEDRTEAYEISAQPGDTLPGTAVTVAAAPASGNTQAASGSGSGSVMTLTTALLFALIGGIILNLMPCVLPVLSIKAIGIAQAASKGDAAHLRLHGLVYIVGVVVSMLVLAGFLIGLRAAGDAAGIGAQLQFPPLVAVFAIVIFLIGLNLYGLFEVGGGLIGVGDGLARRSGVQGAFFTGVLAAVLGAPCIGPFLGAASGWALSQPAAIILLFFAILGLGLALPFALISFVPGLQKLLPKPGQWMIRLRQAFAFPMFLTAAWLIWVLAMNPSAGPNAVAATLIAATLVVFAIWLFQSLPEKRTLLRYAGLGLASVSLISGAAIAVTGTQYRAPALEVVEWSPEAVSAARAEGTPIFVDFTAAWCVTCQLNKQTTLRSKTFVNALAAEDGIFMEADWTDQNDTIAEELKAFGRAGVPLYLYYPEDGADPIILNQVLSPGYVKKIIQQN